MSFCPDCKSILDISKTGTKKAVNFDDTASEMSDDNEDKIKIIIEKITSKQKIDNIDNINVEQIKNHEAFKKLDKAAKTSVLEKIARLESRSQNQDDGPMAFYKCKACGYSKPIETGTIVMSRLGISTQKSYENLDKYKNKIYNRALPRTRQYICPNKNCVGTKDHTKHEAVMYRLGDSTQICYTCVACQEVFVGQ